MHGFPAKHRVLVRSPTELDARDLLNLPPINSIPVVGPLVSPLVGNGAGGGAQPSIPLNPHPAPMSTASSGDGSGNGGGNTPTPTEPLTSSGGTAVPPVSIVSSPTSPTSIPGKPSSSSSAQNTSSGGSTAKSSSPGGGGNYLAPSGGQTAPVNVGTTPAALGTPPPGALASGISSSSQSSLGSGSNTVGTVVSSPTITTAAATSSGNQLSGGAIAGITIVCLFFLLALILLVVRCRSIVRRAELRRRWWFTRNASGGNFSLVDDPSSPVGPNGELPASRLSARSSFATNFDQGLMFRVDSPPRFSLTVFPDLPPLAEVRERNSVLISTGAAVARRESLNSMLSQGSDPDAQYLTYSTGQNNLEPSTPMFVRPFSPSESFAFPKPPAPSSSTMDAFFISGTHGPTSSQSSASTLVQLSTPPRAFMTDLPPAPNHPPSFHPQTLTPSVPFSPFIAAADPSVDPFSDPVKPEFADVEVIRRPFVPSLDDELAVHPGDGVRILQIFDDGWAFVDRLAGTEGERYERGLIPVDCLREAGQPLPTFLAQKRVVSYASDQLIDMEV